MPPYYNNATICNLLLCHLTLLPLQNTGPLFFLAQNTTGWPAKRFPFLTWARISVFLCVSILLYGENNTMTSYLTIILIISSDIAAYFIKWRIQRLKYSLARCCGPIRNKKVTKLPNQNWRPFTCSRDFLDGNKIQAALRRFHLHCKYFEKVITTKWLKNLTRKQILR